MSSEAPPRKRPLTAEEAELWAFAMREAKALRRERERHEAAVMRSQANVEPPPAPTVESNAPPAGTKRKAASPAPLKQRSPEPPKSPPALARYNERERRKLVRDADLIDARLDLHGMRQREAHGALRRFLLVCLSRGDRHVLVITGKGGAAETGGAGHHYSIHERGVLRRLVPLWLGEPELRGIVVSYATASVRHGGEGALYVRLRKAPVIG